jgi:hypothetical protein
MQFFGMNDDSLIPRSRLASGEPPRGWEVRIEAGDALFLAYPDHGWWCFSRSDLSIAKR